MEDTATIDPGTAEAQSTETESAAAEAPVTQAAAPAGQPDLKALLKREKDDPNVQFTDAELDVLDAHYADGEQKTKPKAKAAEPKVEAEDEETDDEPESNTEAEAKDEEAKEDPEPDADAKAILKEVGGKNLKDAAAKIKDLKRLVGGKDAQAVARVTKEKEDLVNSGKSLWTALRNGDPKAVAFAEKTFGVKFAGKGQPEAARAAEGSSHIDPNLFIDPESANLVNAAIQRVEQAAQAKIKALEDRFGTIEKESERHIQETVAKQSTMQVVDEMAEIASKIPELKSLSGFRELAAGVLNGKHDPRLDVFTKLFDIAAEENVNLRQAYLIQRGRDSDLLEAKAIEKGRQAAFNQKPNPSLSGLAGGKGESSYQPVTEADLERWANDHRTHPESWYDKDGDLIKSKVPKRAWGILDLK
jgi:hypothetical protein